MDDLSIERNHRKADAVLEIFALAEGSEFSIVGSEVLALELNLIQDPDRREAAHVLFVNCDQTLLVNDAADRRASELHGSGFRAMDAYHLALAEEANCDALLTTDDDFIRRAQKISLGIRVMNPIQWLQEQDR